MLTIDKNPKQQKFHADMLADCKRVLDKYKVKSILSGSALLGVIRDNDLIPWSPGCILIVDFKEVKPFEDKIKGDLLKKGFRIARHFRKPGNWKIRADKNIINIEITGYNLKNHVYSRSSGKRIKVIPSRYLKNLIEIEFKGMKYNIPVDYEKFLTHLYGNWRKVIKSEIRHSYKAKSHTRYK